MKPTNRFALLFAAAPLWACGGQPPSAEHDLGPVKGAIHDELSTASTAKLPGLPQQLRCVSAAFAPPSTFVPQVARVALTARSGTYVATSTVGAQFLVRAGGAASATSSPRTATLRQRSDTAAGRITLESRTRSLKITLARAGVAWTGALADRRSGGTKQNLTCWSDEALTPGTAALPAHFDWSTHKCVDARGRPALNRIPIEVVRETSFGECADLSGVKLNGADLGYPDLAGWSLMGAKLAGASLHFANLTNASLQGVDLSAFEFGYAQIKGHIDEATVLPSGEGGACTVTTSPWAGQSCACLR